MPYRLTPKSRERQARKLEAMRRGRDAARMARTAEGRMPDLPTLRRRVTVEDFDTGMVVAHTFDLLRSRRVDSYNVMIDGKPWKRCGWSKVCEVLRKAHQRLPSPRSDIWTML